MKNLNKKKSSLTEQDYAELAKECIIADAISDYVFNMLEDIYMDLDSIIEVNQFLLTEEIDFKMLNTALIKHISLVLTKAIDEAINDCASHFIEDLNDEIYWKQEEIKGENKQKDIDLFSKSLNSQQKKDLKRLFNISI